MENDSGEPQGSRPFNFNYARDIPDDWFDRLMAAYVDVLQEHRDMLAVLGAISDAAGHAHQP